MFIIYLVRGDGDLTFRKNIFLPLPLPVPKPNSFFSYPPPLPPLTLTPNYSLLEDNMPPLKLFTEYDCLHELDSWPAVLEATGSHIQSLKRN